MPNQTIYLLFFVKHILTHFVDKYQRKVNNNTEVMAPSLRVKPR